MKEIHLLGVRHAASRRAVWGTYAGPALLALGSLSLALAGCDGQPIEGVEEEPLTGDVTLQVAYQNALSETATETLHAWVLIPRGDAQVSCADLVAGEIDPYDYSLIRLADVVFRDLAGELKFESEVGQGLLYVEAVDFSGEAHLAGCTSLDLGEGGATASVNLSKAGVYDCGDSKTQDGSRCDDGVFCTVGETCKAGACQGGRARDCSGQANSCSAGTCSEDKGCQYLPQADDTPCDDGLFCTENDSCQQGRCVGAAVDCSEQAGACQLGGFCSEFSGGCSFTDAPTFTPCDDDDFCTVTTQCLSGSCSYNPQSRLCPISDCNPVNTCNSGSGACVPTPAAVGTPCDDNPCLVGGGTCDGSGSCTGTPLTEPTPCTIDCRAGSCDASGTCVLAENVVDGTACAGSSGTCVDGACAQLGL